MYVIIIILVALLAALIPLTIIQKARLVERRKKIEELQDNIATMHEVLAMVATGGVEIRMEGGKIVGRLVEGQHPTIH